MKHQHFVVTRYTLRGFAYDEFSPQWLDERLRMFRTYCVPSIAQQVEDFTWLLLCDETTDPGYVTEIRSSAASVPQLRICMTSATRGIRQRQVVQSMVEPDTDLLITTRVDSDDALHANAIATVSEYIAPFVSSPYEAWGLRFPRGYRYDEGADRVYASYWPNGPFVSLFEKLGPDKSALRNVYFTRHPRLHLEVPIHLDESLPGWLQVIHGLAESTEAADRTGRVLTGGNRSSRVTETDIEVSSAEIAGMFGIS